MLHLEAFGRVAQPGEGEGDGALPALLLEVAGVQAHPEAVGPPVVEAQQRPDAEPAHPGPAGPGHGLQAVVIIALAAPAVHLPVGLPVVGLHVEGDPFQAPVHQEAVVRLIQGVDLHGHGDEVLPGDGHGLGQVLHRRHLGGFAGEEQDVLEPVAGQDGAFGADFLRRQGAPLANAPGVQGVTAVGAVGVADVGQVNGGVEPDGPAEVLPGEMVRRLGHVLQERRRRRRQQGRQVLRKQTAPGARPA